MNSVKNRESDDVPQNPGLHGPHHSIWHVLPHSRTSSQFGDRRQERIYGSRLPVFAPPLTTKPHWAPLNPHWTPAETVPKPCRTAPSVRIRDPSGTPGNGQKKRERDKMKTDTLCFLCVLGHFSCFFKDFSFFSYVDLSGLFVSPGHASARPPWPSPPRDRPNFALFLALSLS